MEFRKVIHDGDLITEVKVEPFPLIPIFSHWVAYRNESEEARAATALKDQAFKQFKEMEQVERIVHANVKHDLDLLKKYKGENSEVVCTMPNEQSLLEKREGIKYNTPHGKRRRSNRRNGKGKGQQHQGSKKGETRRVSLLALLSGAEIEVPTKH